MNDADVGWFSNPSARTWQCDRPGDDVVTFHRSLTGYGRTDLVELPAVAEELGVGRVLIKVESARMGLPAFKILGASYAVSRALSARLGQTEVALPLDTLRAELDGQPTVELVAATDGNHGRAVAHVARLLGLESTIFFPASLTSEAKAAIGSEGARTVTLDIDYDDVVTAATEHARTAGEAALLIQDTAWPGYEEVPGWIVDGYSTMFLEVDDQLAELDADHLDAVLVPVGVGSLAQAAVRHHRSTSSRPVVMSVEADRAPAILCSLQQQRLVTVDTSFTVMSGLNCGTPSSNAWPYLVGGLDAAIAVTDDDTIAAVHDLESMGIDAGPCGAATLPPHVALSW